MWTPVAEFGVTDSGAANRPAGPNPIAGTAGHYRKFARPPSSLSTALPVFRVRGDDLNRAGRPRDKFLTVFEYVRRHLEVIHRQRPPGFLVSERPHAAFDEGNARCVVHFEIKPALHKNSKEPPGLIQPVPAEHRFGAQVGQGAQLVEDEGFEGIVRHWSWERRHPCRRVSGTPA